MISLCHQYKLRQKYLKEDLKFLGFDPSFLRTNSFEYSVEEMDIGIISFIERYEWLGTIGVNPKWIFTARFHGLLGGVILINEPNAYSKILGEDTRKYEALIQRGACASWTPKNLGSRLVMFALNWMVQNTEKKCFVAYSDFEAGEIGTIYQACNFEYLGSSFGNRYVYKHPTFKNGEIFSDQTLKRTSTLKKWLKDNNISKEKEWFKENGFKDIKSIPKDILDNWVSWRKQILAESIKISQQQKGKYVLVLGKNKTEQKKLNKMKQYIPKKYPKRSI
jgi:hypothetical protein